MYIENLKKVRKALNLSAAELSEQVGIPARTIGGYERGERKMSLEIVTQLRKKYNVNANWFVTGEGDMFNTEETKNKQFKTEICEEMLKLLKKEGIIK